MMDIGGCAKRVVLKRAGYLLGNDVSNVTIYMGSVTAYVNHGMGYFIKS